MSTYFAVVCTACRVGGPSVVRRGQCWGPGPSLEGLPEFVGEHHTHVAALRIVSEHDEAYEWHGPSRDPAPSRPRARLGPPSD
jgi:hypothetical protein